MRGIEEFRDIQAEATEWRRYLHQNPELEYGLYITSSYVAEKLASFGIDRIETGIAETGIVAVIQGADGDGPTIGLRADMDALPILEASKKPWISENEGKMHACGHDGHTSMLLGAAKYLASTRNFRGAVALIFQPIPDSVELGGTVRSLSPALRDFAELQIEACARGIGNGFGAKIEFRHRRLEPLTFNHTGPSSVAAAAA